MRLLSSWLIVALSAAATADALACSCNPNNTLQDYYEFADKVFLARVSRVVLTRVPRELAGNSWLDPGNQPSNPIVRADIRVIEWFKGDGVSFDAVYTHRESSACGLSMAARQEFLFFADKDGIVSMCGGHVRADAPGWENTIRQLIRGWSTSSEKPPRTELD